MLDAVSDPLHHQSPPRLHWTTSNIGEALPGIPTPLSFTLFGSAIENAMRGAFHATGAYTTAELPLAPLGEQAPPGVYDRITSIFHGRPVLLVDSMVTLGDRMPGTSGERVVKGFYGTVPEDIDYRPTRRRYPAIAVKLIRSHFTIGAMVNAAQRDIPPWWQKQVERIPSLSDPAQTRAVFHEAAERFHHTVLLQAIAAMCAVQPAYDAVSKLATRAGVSDVNGLTSGYGSVPETAVVHDIWRAARGEMDIAALLRLHGHHGPLEGELSGRVWREDDTPLRRLVDEYRKRPDSDPLAREQQRRLERLELERRVLAGLPRAARPVARRVLARASEAIPLRGVAKGAFLQAFDVARAAARRTGELWAEQGLLAEADDVFYLCMDELFAGIPVHAKDLVSQRREWRRAHEAVRLPTNWSGMPVPIPVGAPSERAVLEGIGVSGGVAEGIARVVTDPTFADVEPGEILVSSTTDPGWASIMFISAALVVDIGGHLSHAAVVARELGIPCVVETRDGSRVIHSGDLLRVDGDTGTVEILSRA